MPESERVNAQIPKLPEPGIEIGLDWLRLTGRDDRHATVRDFLIEHHGAPNRSGKGAMYFAEGEWWDPGILLSRGHSADTCMIDVQGSRLRLMDAVDRVALLADLIGLEMKPTRIDGAIDWIGQDVRLHAHARAACDAEQLCHARKFGKPDEYTNDGVPLKLLLTVGARDSPTCARIYDKGLEQKVAPPGVWERLEVEWKDSNAFVVAHALMDAGPSWAETLRAYVLSAFDFREKNGQSALDRRPRLAWWDALRDGCETLRPSAAQKDPSFERYLAWSRRSVGPRMLEFAHAAHITLEELVAIMFEGVEPSTSGGPLVAGCVEWLHSHAGPIAGEHGSHGPSHPVPGTT